MSQQTEQARSFAKHDVRQAILYRESQLLRGTSGGGKLSAAAQSYTRDANMAIVTRVLQLPRELRDNIYIHLWELDDEDDPGRSLLFRWRSFNEPWFSERKRKKSRRLVTPLAIFRPPHFIDKCFVGPVFAKEALEQFKDCVGKDLRPIGEIKPVNGYDLADDPIGGFVKKDVFGVGITMEELVRNLDLGVEFYCYSDSELAEYHKRNMHDQGSLVTDTITYTRDDYLRDLNDSVTTLLNIPHHERIITHNEHGRHMSTRARVVNLTIRQE